MSKNSAISTISVAPTAAAAAPAKGGPSSTVGECAIVDVDRPAVDPSDKANVYHIWALGMVAVMGGQYYDWNERYAAGFVPFFCASLMMSTSFVVYVACISEVSGKVPGGSYGLARAVLGFYPGFILGCLELLEYISFGSVSILFVTNYATDYFGWDERVKPLLWLIQYVVFIALLESRGKYVWRFMLVFAIICLLPMVLYVFGSIPYLDLAMNGVLVDPDTNETTWAKGDVSSAFFKLLPATTVGYAGIEALTVVTGFVENPAYAVPRGTVAATWTLFASFLALNLVVAAMPPGLDTTHEDQYFLNRGLSLGLGLSSDVAEWMMIPAQMGMAFGFFIPYARLTQAMADSNLLPAFLGIRGQPTTVRAMVVASIFGYLLCVVSFFSDEFQKTLQNISIVAACICYASQTYGFVLLRTTYRIDTTGYKSPYGLVGAYYVWFVSLLLFLSIAGGFQGDHGIAILSAFAFVLVMTAYYWQCCKLRQTVSREEYSSIFKFSVMRFNRMRRKKKSKPTASSKRPISQASLVSLAKKFARPQVSPAPP
ncbi:unnamed protein product [Aphanomyces euteiches]|uniref:Amino acid permease/ SLC12A domain-containing protein n=1 Tax=Aphanomyces euteiches TaxID=100861 RepID=A0A6G0W6X3_9STRA|nr:hypothetical protein Ae201684_018145 [Aphanomyces euteiches]KAH9073991.1 hypothetical protein Ae201684P_015890 [Aphanomyces euteiches]KAH9142572.1 hypothetical protein AeRB84_013366 [Aphanomyces euteiches]